MRAHYLDSMREWPTLPARPRQYRDEGVAVDAPQMQALAQHWLRLFLAYAGDDPQTQRKIRQANAQEPAPMEASWASTELLAYLGEAVAALQAA